MMIVTKVSGLSHSIYLVVQLWILPYSVKHDTKIFILHVHVRRFISMPLPQKLSIIFQFFSFYVYVQ